MYRLISDILWMVLGFAIPGYQTFKLLKSGFGLAHVNEFQNLLKFWLVIASLTVLSFFTDAFLFWFPFYYESKIVLIFYLALPQIQGYTSFYEKYIFPTLSQREREIDEKAELYYGLIKEQFSYCLEYGYNYFFEVWHLLLIKGKEIVSQSRNISVTRNSSLQNAHSQAIGHNEGGSCYTDNDSIGGPPKNLERSWMPGFASFRGSSEYISSKLSFSPKFSSSSTNQESGTENSQAKVTTLANLFEAPEEKLSSPKNTNREVSEQSHIELEMQSYSATDATLSNPPNSEERSGLRTYLRDTALQTSSEGNLRSRFN